MNLQLQQNSLVLEQMTLTQGTFSFSREDVEGKFLPEYMEKELLERSPFQSIDVNGVGSLMKIGIAQWTKIRKIWKLEFVENMEEIQDSIKFCHGAGPSYVSASPHRIPIAIVAAAQAAIEPKKSKKIQKIKNNNLNILKPIRINFENKCFQELIL